MSKKITIFTPTYNRAYCIHELYKSLKRQSCMDFEWIILDDGSTDNTNQLCEKWIREDNTFEIIYIKTKNKGKMSAINKGVKLSTTPLFFIVDSDDYLSNDAIEKVIDMYASIEDKSKFCGVAGLRVHKNGKLIGTTFDGNYIDGTSLERAKYKITGDKSEVFFTDILKRYKFPEFAGEKFITENVVWLKMASDGYLIRWFNEPIYICEYMEGGLSDLVKKDLLKNFYGDIYTDSLYIKFYRYSLLMRIRLYGGAYERYLIDKDTNKMEFILKTFGINKVKLFLSYRIYRLYRRIRRKM